MKIFTLAFALAFAHFAQAQINLKLDYNCKNPASSFSNVEVIDNREGQKLLGYIHKGISNNSKQIIFDGSIADSLANFFKGRNETSPNGQKLVFILNELFMNENTSEIPENGKLKLSVKLFIENDQGKYAELFGVDSIFVVKGMDVTKKLFRLVSEQFCAISQIAGETKPDLDKPAFTRDELLNLDRLEMKQIPIYSDGKLNAGIFKDFQHFKENKPDIATEIVVERSKKGKLTAYRIYPASRNKIRLESTGLYAISDGMNLYKATPAGFFEIKNTGDGLYYERSGSFTDPNNGAVAGMYFGVSGAIIASALMPPHNINLFRFKISHRKGNSIPIGVVGY